MKRSDARNIEEVEGQPADKRRKKQGERTVREAVKQLSREEIEASFVNTGLGVNERHEYGCNPLMFAVDESEPEAVESLLSLGARIEDSERGYTPLFTAVENGDTPASEVLMRHGASLAGGFDFNKETPLSIAGFKFCNELVGLLTNRKIEALLDIDPCDPMRFQNMCFENHRKAGESLRRAPAKPYYLNYNASANEWIFCDINPTNPRYHHFKPEENPLGEEFPWLSMRSMFIEMIIQFWSDMDDLWANRGAPWINFAQVPKYLESVLVSGLTIYNNFKKHLGPEFEDKKLEAFYQTVLQLKKVEDTALGKRRYASEEQLFQESFSVKPPVYKKTREKRLTRHQVERAVETLNEELKTKTESEIDWSKYPKFFIADYRGIHYYGKHFTAAQVEMHASTHQLNRIAPAPAVFSMDDKSPAEHVLMSENVVQLNRRIIMRVFDDLDERGEEDQLHELMANDYSGHQTFVANNNSAVAQTLRESKITKYPYYAASVMPDHPLRYALGLKSIKGLSNTTRRPNFDGHGKLKNRVLGKMYITLFEPEQIAEHKKRSAIGKHNQGRLNLREQVAPEREVDAPGGVLPEAMFHEEVLAVPDFSQPYQASYWQKYGLSQEHFAYYAKNLRNRAVVKELLQSIVDHKKAQYIRLAQNEAKRRGGYLIYWNGSKHYSLEPERVRPFGRRFKAEDELLRSVDSERFASGSTTHDIRLFFASGVGKSGKEDGEEGGIKPNM